MAPCLRGGYTWFADQHLGGSETVNNIIGTAQVTGAADLISASMSGGLLADFATVMGSNAALSGGSALIIALAALTLPRSRRLQGVILGTAATVLARAFLACLPGALLNVPCLRLCGGLLILAIGLRLLVDGHSPKMQKETPGGSMKAFLMIVLADLAMSPDSVLTVASASKENPALAFLGLCVSVPIVAFGGGFISRLMGRYTPAVYAGAAILGKVAVDTVLADRLTVRFLHTPGPAMRYGAEMLVAVGFVATGMFLVRLREMRHPAVPAPHSGPFHLTGWDIR